MRLGSLVVLLVLLAACEEATPPAKAPAVEKLPPPSPPLPPIVQRMPSKEMAAHFPFKDEEITTLAYSDLGLLSSPDHANAIAAGLAPAATELGGVDRACLDAVVGGAKELLVAGTNDQQWVVVVKVPGHKLDAVCQPKAGEAETIEGATKAWRFTESGRSCGVTADWLACGTPALVQRSLAGTNEPMLPVGLDPQQILTLDDRDPVRDLKATLASQADRLEARVELTYDTDERPRVVHELASRAADDVKTFNAELKANAEQKALIDLVANGVVASHRGTHATLRVDLAGTPAEQAARIGTALSLFGNLSIRDRNDRRKAQAKAQLQAIADQIAKNWESKDPKMAFGDRKLVALPPIPKEVPKGQRVTVAEADWKGWKDLPHLTTPTFFQFESKVDKDGQACDLLAHADMNGDGKVSTFKLHIRVDSSSKQLMIEPKIEETNPDE